ncbi:hypothetical protein MOTT27_01833 [Mycobacterium intracellulare subsp. yongonense]|nr:hypothetical protein MOTT27_01833 [Mycobacterium intracellulare subsp. yongonense]
MPSLCLKLQLLDARVHDFSYISFPGPDGLKFTEPPAVGVWWTRPLRG